MKTHLPATKRVVSQPWKKNPGLHPKGGTSDVVDVLNYGDVVKEKGLAC